MKTIAAYREEMNKFALCVEEDGKYVYIPLLSYRGNKEYLDAKFKREGTKVIGVVEKK